MEKKEYYVLVKEYNSSKHFVLSYDILAISKSANVLKEIAIKFCNSILSHGDKWLNENRQNDSLVTWQSGRRYYVGYSKDPSTNVCYSVLEKPIKEY